MAALNHVCMWQENGWKRISAREAATLHPGGTVSAHSGLFMCELCGQYVMLTDGDTQVRHFRHSSSEKSKDCPERVIGASAGFDYASNEHDLPLKIRTITHQGFEFEIGFIRVPKDLLSHDLRVDIYSDCEPDLHFIYSEERFFDSGITYLSVGQLPVAKYRIDLINAADNLRQFWPSAVPGVDRNGTVFHAETRLRVASDADVRLGEKYYIVKTGRIYGRYSGISIKEISTSEIHHTTWRVYEVYAEDLTEDAARFFLDYHCRLTEKPGALKVIWPPYIEEQNLIKYNDSSVVIHISGYPTMRVFPNATTRNYTTSTGKVVEAFLNERQQLISVRRTKALEYAYYWKESLYRANDRPQIEVVDADGYPVEASERNDLPRGKTLCVTAPFDGIVEIWSQGCQVDRRQLRAGQKCIVDNLAFEMKIRVFVGLDCVWEVAFMRKRSAPGGDEEALLNRLRHSEGREIPITHTIAGAVAFIGNYPKLRRWLYSCIRKGTMPESAYKYLRFTLNDMRLKG